MKRRKGFSLIELIVVIAVIGILTSIAAVSARDWVTRYQVEGQTKQLYSDLMKARTDALQRNRFFFVTLASNQYALYEDTYSAATGTSSVDGDGSLQQGAGQDRLIMQKTTQYRLNFSSANFNFNQSGLVSWNSGTIWVTSPEGEAATDCIRLETTRIVMGKWNGTTSICNAQ